MSGFGGFGRVLEELILATKAEQKKRIIDPHEGMVSVGWIAVKNAVPCGGDCCAWTLEAGLADLGCSRHIV